MICPQTPPCTVCPRMFWFSLAAPAMPPPLSDCLSWGPRLTGRGWAFASSGARGQCGPVMLGPPCGFLTSGTAGTGYRPWVNQSVPEQLLCGARAAHGGAAERTRVLGSRKQSCQAADELSSDPGRRYYCPVLSVSVLRGPAWTRGSGGTDSLDGRVSRSHCLGTRAVGEMEAAILGTKSRHIFSPRGFSFPCLRPKSVRFGNDSPYGAGARHEFTNDS